MKAMERQQSRGDKTHPPAQKALTNCVGSCDCGYAKQSRKASQPKLGIAQMQPETQKEVIQRHIGFAPPYCSHKCGKEHPCDPHTEGFIQPKAFRAKHVQTQ